MRKFREFLGFNGYGETDAETFSADGTEVFSWSVVRDNNGRITEKTETFSDGTGDHYLYDYDAVGRLLTVTKDGAVAETYQYDTRPYGTRTYQEVNGVGKTLTYSDEDHLLTAGDVTYLHDADGFLVSRTQGTQVTIYNYSLRGELLSVTLPDGRLIQYVHDPLVRRIAKKISGTVVEKYLWQGLTRLLAVYDGNNNLLMRFEYADGRMPVAMTKAGVRYYLVYDQAGTLKAVADASGNVLLKRQYDSFGNILSEESSLPFDVPFGFAGGLYDRDTGLVRFGYRDYDPETGRWTAKDPIGFSGGDTDLYGYCVNDPVNFADPDGLSKRTGITQGSDEYYQRFKDTKGDQKKIRGIEQEIYKKREDGKISNKRWSILKALIKIAKDGRLFEDFNLLLMFEWQIQLLENPCLLNDPYLPLDEFGIPSS